MKTFTCFFHKDYTLGQLCTDNSCKLKGLICSKCLTKDHKDHSVTNLQEYVQNLQQKQCTDADILRVKQQYRQMETTVRQMLEQVTISIQMFLQQLEKQFQREEQVIEQQRQYQKEQKNLLDRCYRSTSVPMMSKAYLELFQYNMDTKIFYYYDEVKAMINKNSSSVINIDSEGTKIIKDFQEYLKQIVLFIVSDQSEIIRVDQSDIINTSEGIQKSRIHDNIPFSSSPAIAPEIQFDWQIKNSNRNDATFGLKKHQQNEMQTLNSHKDSTQRKLDYSPEPQVVIEVPTSPYNNTQRINDFSRYNRNTNFLTQKNPQNKPQSVENSPPESLSVSPAKKNPIFSTHYQPGIQQQKYSSTAQAPVGMGSGEYQKIYNSVNLGNKSVDRNQLNKSVDYIESQINDRPFILSGEQQFIDIVDAQRLESEPGDIRPMFTTSVHKDVITCVGIHDNYIVTSSNDGYVKFTDTVKGDKVIKLHVSRSSIMQFIIFEEKNQYFMCMGCEDGYTMIYQKMKDNNWKKIQNLKVPPFLNNQLKQETQPVTQLVHLPTVSQNLFVFYRSGTFSIYNWLSAQKVTQDTVTVANQPQPILCASVTAQQVMRKLRIRVITAGGQSNGIITVWGSDVQYAMKNEFQWAGHLRPVTNIHIVRDHLVTASTHEGLIKVWDTLNYKITQIIRPQGIMTNTMEYNNLLFMSYYEKKTMCSSVAIWDLNNLNSFVQYPPMEGKVNCFIIAPKLMVLGMLNGDVTANQR